MQNLMQKFKEQGLIDIKEVEEENLIIIEGLKNEYEERI